MPETPFWTLPPHQGRWPPSRFTRLLNPTPNEYGAFQCPECGTVGVVDEDQAKGVVSILCGQDGCTFHETLVLESPGAG